MPLDTTVKFLAAACPTIIGGIWLYDRLPDVGKPTALAATAAAIIIEAYYLGGLKKKGDTLVDPPSNKDSWSPLKSLYDSLFK
ncbi:MAG TPA: hypothetical protein VI612_02195 [Candidatus Nanoarchaeia archaeon]|nr:hypothetical protein [Candidatus Nanoarchaeia archaeon]